MMVIEIIFFSINPDLREDTVKATHFIHHLAENLFQVARENLP
jgi:hypothetical protein